MLPINKIQKKIFIWCEIASSSTKWTGETLPTHVNKVVSMENLLKDRVWPIPQEMLNTSIVCSKLPSYNSIIAA